MVKNFWKQKTLANLAIAYQFAKVFSTNLLLYLRINAESTNVFSAKHALGTIHKTFLPLKFLSIQYLTSNLHKI